MQNNSVQYSAILIPIKALMGDAAKGFSVWRYNESTQDVNSVNVEIASLTGEYAIIAHGINPGDKLVSAAVNQMSEKLKVKEYKADY